MDKHVLRIDDDQSILVVRKLLIESCGFKALTATSGEKGLHIFNNNPIDAVIVDYMMPEIDGGVVSAAIKRASPQTPIIDDHVKIGDGGIFTLTR
jgi:DNA-binding response OmpR family regulator